MRMTWKTALIRHKNRFRLRSYDARAWCRIQEIPSARIGGANGFPRSHQQIRSEHSEQYGTVARIIHSLLKQTGDCGNRSVLNLRRPLLTIGHLSNAQLGCGYVYAWKIKAPDRLIEESGCFYILDKFAQVLCCGFAPSGHANGLLDGHKMPIEQTRTG